MQTFMVYINWENMYTMSSIALRVTNINTSVYSQVTEHINLSYSLIDQTFNRIRQFIRCSLYQSIKKFKFIYEQIIQLQQAQSIVQDKLGEWYTSFFRNSKFFYSFFLNSGTTFSQEYLSPKPTIEVTGDKCFTIWQE